MSPAAAPPRGTVGDTPRRFEPSRPAPEVGEAGGQPRLFEPRAPEPLEPPRARPESGRGSDAGGVTLERRESGRALEAGGVTLERRLDQVWESLRAAGAAECPVCTGRIVRAGRIGRCGRCGTEVA